MSDTLPITVDELTRIRWHLTQLQNVSKTLMRRHGHISVDRNPMTRLYSIIGDIASVVDPKIQLGIFSGEQLKP